MRRERTVSQPAGPGRGVRRVVFWGLLLTTVVSLYAVHLRRQAEGLSNTVALIVDGEQLQDIAADSQLSITGTLLRMRRAGATGVAVSELLVSDLIDRGMARWLPNPDGVVSRLVVESRSDYERLQQRLSAYNQRGLPSATGEAAIQALLQGKRSGVLIEHRPASGPVRAFYTPAEPGSLRNTPVGLDPRFSRQVSRAGLLVVGRVGNRAGLTAGGVRDVMRDLSNQRAVAVVFTADEVLGFRGLLSVTAAEMRRWNVLYGAVEMGKQRGDAGLQNLLPDHMLRVHSVPLAESGPMAPAELIQRYVRAARERNIRLCYLRIPSVMTATAIDGAEAFVSDLRTNMMDSGLQVGRPRPFTDPGTPLLVMLLAGAGAFLAAMHVVDRLLRLNLGAGWLTAAAVLGLITVALGDPGRKIAALVAACAFPTLGMLELRPYLVRERTIWTRVLRASLCTLAGAMHVVALLATLPYLIKSDQFAGIKLAHLVPVVAAGWYFGLDVWRERDWTGVIRRVGAGLRAWMQSPVTIGLAGMVLIGLAMIVLVLMRTGNDAGMAVTGGEMKARALLEQWLSVRPRTKEFLLGHPALILGLVLAGAGAPQIVVAPLLLLGALGQASMLNTFCHIHTPFDLSLIRAMLGLVLGSALGAVLSRIAVPRRQVRLRS